jgi:serine/threonine protein kinase
MLQQHVLNVLQAAGVPLYNEDAIYTMEIWLGLREEVGNSSIPTVEDSLPLSNVVMAATQSLLIEAWNGSIAESSNERISDSMRSSHRNASSSLYTRLLELAQAESNRTSSTTRMLERACACVQVTHWLRAWMEFNVSDDELDVDPGSSISRRLLRESNTAKALIQALFRHLQDLPDLQQQLLSYIQHIQRSGVVYAKEESSSVTATSNPSLRLQQYERAAIVGQALQSEWQQHVLRLEFILGDFYSAANAHQRCSCRQGLGHIWTQFLLRHSEMSGRAVGGMRQENTSAAALRTTLLVLRRILRGMDASLWTSVLQHLLYQQLLPLHQVDGVVLWRDQMPILELYHEPLCQCIALLVVPDPPHRIPTVISALLQPNIFPSVGSTSKQVLLLHEVDTYLKLLVASTNTAAPEDPKSLQEEAGMMKHLLQTLARCMSSEHSRVAERALQFFQTSTLDALVLKYVPMTWRTLLPALIRREPSWNPTVRKMTYHVLQMLQSYNENDSFVTICNELFAHHVATAVVDIVPPASETVSKLFAPSPSNTVTDYSLKAGMGSWKPPPSLPHSNLASIKQPPIQGFKSFQGAPPPSTITGVAPWAVQQRTPSAPPPSTITGVAPWAVQPPTRSRPSPQTEATAPPASTDQHEVPKTGYKYVLMYMEKIKPPQEVEGASPWSVAQMAETPTLLPNLKFHDLVFGHDLGTGAFGSVKYARLIDKSKSRSQWAEYAVKVVSTEKIREMGYEASIQREIAVLHFLSHPGIARLVSSFRFHDGAYLVLEYASRGDLHNLLQKHGSLDMESTRFVVGEVVAALSRYVIAHFCHIILLRRQQSQYILCSIHDAGFVYGDLKPENIVITEPGHIKITDFGGCRPVTDAAKELIGTFSKDILKNLRDGNWKASAPTTRLETDSFMEDGSDHSRKDDFDGENGLDDNRIEGTTAYLPPEVVLGGFPTIAADSWALGCVTYQCLSGRPPLLDSDDGATRNRIVSFDVDGMQSSSAQELLFSDKHAAGITMEARGMILALLDRDPLKRPTMHQLGEHEFFRGNVFRWHSQPAYPLDVGTVGPTPNAQWARRQFSSIWAPQPEAYDVITPPPSSAGPSRSADDEPIVEGEEASGFFSASGKLPLTEQSFITGKRHARMMLPPSYE